MKFILGRKRINNLRLADFAERMMTEQVEYLKEMAGIVRYTQSHSRPQGYARGELDFDCIEEVEIASPSALEGIVTSGNWDRLVGGPECLIDRDRSIIMAVEGHVAKAGIVRPGSLKGFQFVQRKSGLSQDAFVRYWRNVHGPLAARIPTLLRYEHNYTCPNPSINGVSELYDGVGVTWFESSSEMKRGRLLPEFEASRLDEPNLLNMAKLPYLITTEYLYIGE
jgi:uncharacterized protein (TIGR02118 family)